MTYSIKYAALCHKGYVRSKNQDNLWCDGIYLQSKNEGLSELLFGENEVLSFPAYAVFDGMGGEQQGEMAAYIAASNFNILYNELAKSDIKAFLLDICLKINMKICEYQKENHIRQMGTTAAIIMCEKNAVYICNVGDSRIYQYGGKKLTQISQDHIELGVNEKKAPLTQNLGISETEFIIEPYIIKGKYNNRECFLICSDGLTDMLPDSEIENVFKNTRSISETAQMLMSRALQKGGVDNITIIIIETRKQTWVTKLR